MAEWRNKSRAAASKFIAALCLLASFSTPLQAETKVILGIFYYGCDELCHGVQFELADSGFDVKMDVRNLQQDMALVPGLIEEARTRKVDLVITHGTSATLGTIGRLEDAADPRFLSDIPVVFTQVADPFGSNIAESFERSGRKNVAGTFNRVPEAVNIQVVRSYDPSFDKLGLLYNSNEENSVIKRDELAALAPTLGVELVALEIEPGVSGPPDPEQIPERMAELAAAGVEWLYLGSSSFLRQNGTLFTESAVEHGIAVVSPYEALVRDSSALLSIAAREEDVGRLAARQALAILRDGKIPGELPILSATDFAYVVNMDVARALDRIPPFAFLQIAATVQR
ncbi:ABC transporter substrate-binding protein [Defluviimonas sp. WL0002]|uniref:ABC transporter substrate-binding protein n=1 Tax=Albidovulum marisflavi TaxID=2984159 RepID=A0ABT2ZGP7_9RHOB|nr:ABC transporter substrate-binding protein [Defluviimonas sp. WL0002]MCV2870297.1 ABC transporter substrate-binding protein [Defluviimonas sp. WL0002]